MILAYHVIFCAYGFWLPNDPRGSWSDFVGRWELAKFGGATRTNSRRSLAHDPHDRERRRAAKKTLQRPPVRFTGRQAREIARAFKAYIERAGLRVHACAILPEHVHMVWSAHRLPAERIVNQLKGAATRRLGEPGLWSRGQWIALLNSRQAVQNAITYVEQNPLREGKPPQRWSFVQPYL